MASVPEHNLEWRRQSGAGQWDEVWNGVLHMAPSPNRDHQELEFDLESWLRQHWAKPTGARVYHQISVSRPGTWPNDYRIPDLVLLTSQRFEIDRNEYFDGGPDAVVEIRSPGDETYDKLGFYAEAGVREVWIVQRDSKEVEMFAIDEERLQPRPPASTGWVRSDVADVELRSAGAGKLEIRCAGRDGTLVQYP